MKTKVIPILLISLLTISALIVIFPTALAQEVEYSKTTHCFIGAVPNPVGVNQEVLLHIGMFDFLRLYHHGWKGLTVTVTNPNGETETLGPYDTDATGGTGDIFVPTMVGTYKFQTHFPEQTYDWEGGIARAPFEGVVNYEASTSDILELVVQEDQVEYYPGHSTPNEYWTRPIDAQLREWSQVSGNWLETTRYAGPMANCPAPQSGHILWTKPLEYGGLVGSEMGSVAFTTGDAYEGKFANSVVINGILYYNQFPSRGSGVEYDVVAADLKTGEELWRRNWGRVLDFGQIFYWDAFNMHGAFAYLWETTGSTWNAYDPNTGRWEYAMENVPSGTRVTGPKGEIYIYTVDLDNGWMTLWNSSRTVNPADQGDSNDGSWRPQGNTFDATRGIEWNVSIPTGLKGSVSKAFYGDRLLGTTARGLVPDLGRDDIPIEFWAINLKPGKEGELLWENIWSPPPGDYAIAMGDSSVEDGVFTAYAKEIRAHFGFDINTGQEIWGPSESEPYQMVYMMHIKIRFGKLYCMGYGGVLYAYNLNTGERLWEYAAKDELSEMNWGNNWALYPAFFTTDEKIVVFNTEHSTIMPMARGSPLLCLDANTGDLIWDLNLRGHHWGGHPLIADEVIVTINSYDNQIYAIGKGPSEITALIENDVIALGRSALVKGTVTDISAGTKSHACQSRFPAGVPVVADQNMNAWMQYVYMQHERPEDTTGVAVTLEAVDPNNNYHNLGTTTTDSYGNYGFSFEPEVEGLWTIMATFEGSNSYYGSTQTTYLEVGSTTPGTPIEPEQPNGTQLITTEVAIIAAVAVAAVIGVAAYWFLKRK